jgi:hypothetical protein
MLPLLNHPSYTLDQLEWPTCVFFDADLSVPIANCYNPIQMTPGNYFNSTYFVRKPFFLAILVSLIIYSFSNLSREQRDTNFSLDSGACIVPLKTDLLNFHTTVSPR